MKATSKGGSGGAGNNAAGPGGAATKKKKEKGKEPYRQVYNWAFYHSLDFWSTVLAIACDNSAGSGESELRPLIYPLVQISLGVIKLVPTARYYPLRFQVLTSLLRVSARTGTYIPIAPFLLEILDSSALSKKPKNSTLKPLDWTYYLAAPAAYPGTRVYTDGIVEELAHILLEFLTSNSESIAFPELTLPITISLRRHIKKSKNPKITGTFKALVERLEANATFIEEKREKVEFSPQDRKQIEAFQRNIQGENTPLKSYLKLQRKVRDQKRELLERSLKEGAEGDDNIVDGESEEDDNVAMEED